MDRYGNWKRVVDGGEERISFKVNVIRKDFKREAAEGATGEQAHNWHKLRSWAYEHYPSFEAWLKTNVKRIESKPIVDIRRSDERIVAAVMVLSEDNRGREVLVRFKYLAEQASGLDAIGMSALMVVATEFAAGRREFLNRFPISEPKEVA